MIKTLKITGDLRAFVRLSRLVPLVAAGLLFMGAVDQAQAEKKREKENRALEIQELLSDKGLKAWYIQDQSLPIISISFSFHAGSVNDPVDKEGLAYFLSLMLTEGAGELDSQAFSAALNDAGIHLNFTVGRDYFTGTMTTLAHNKDLAAQLLSDVLLRPRFDEASFQRSMAQLLTGLEIDAKDPQWLGMRELRGLIYPEHPYARRQRGTPQTLAKISAKDLRDFQQLFFAKDNLVIGISGAIEAAQAKDYIDDIFASLPQQAQPNRAHGVKFENAGRISGVDLPIPQTKVLVAMPGVDRNHPDYLALYLANHILGAGSFTSRLWTELREKSGLTYSAYSTLSQAEQAPLIQIGFNTQNENAGKALKMLILELEKIQQEGVTAQELEQAKAYVIGNYPLRLTSIQALSNYTHSLQIAQLGRNYYQKREALINAISLEDVNRVVAKFFDPSQMRIVTVGQPVQMLDSVDEQRALVLD